MTDVKNDLKPLDGVDMPVRWSDVADRTPSATIPESSRWQRISAGVVAFGVFAVAAFFAWIALRPVEGSPAASPTIGTSPTPTGATSVSPVPSVKGDTGPIPGYFYPGTYFDDERVIMPLVFMDGSRAEVDFDSDLQPAELGGYGFIAGGLNGIDRNIDVRYGDGRFFMMSGPLERYSGDGGSSVGVWEGDPDGSICPRLVFTFGNWFAGVRVCEPSLSDEEKAEWARLLVGREKDDGFLLLRAAPPLELAEVGEHSGPSMLLQGRGGAPFIVLTPGPTRDTCAENPIPTGSDEEILTAADGQRVLLAKIGPTWHASWCEDGLMQIGVSSPDRSYVEAAALGGLRVREVSLAE